MKSLKILHIITDFDSIYGAQKHVIECLKDHLEKGYSCKVVTGNKGIAGKLVESLGIEVIEMNSLERAYNIVNDIKVIKNIIQLIRSYQPNLVISHSTKAGVVARIACFKCKLPNIFTVHGWAFEKGTPMVQKVVGWTIEYALKYISDSYWCVSNYTASYGKASLNIKKRAIYVCPPMHSSLQLGETVKTDKFNVLMLAGFRQQKDHFTALKALQYLINELGEKDIHFIFLGDGPQKLSIQNWINEFNVSNNITLVGETNNVTSFYNQSKMVILPTFYEGLPITLIEAIQSQKTIIATNVGGISEILLDGQNGYLINIQDFKSLAIHIARLKNDAQLLQSMNESSFKIYNEQYSRPISVLKMNDIINNTLSNTRFNTT